MVRHSQLYSFYDEGNLNLLLNRVGQERTARTLGQG